MAGKPHPEQGQIGGLRVSGSSPGWLLEPIGNGGPRWMVTAPGQSWSTEPGLQARPASHIALSLMV